jgi:hypothetical protein
LCSFVSQKQALMKKLFYIFSVVIPACCFAGDNVPCSQSLPPNDTGAFTQSKTAIQTSYNEMYKSLPYEQRQRIQSAAVTIENLRLKSPQDAETFLSIQRASAEQSMQTAVTQMLVTDAAKTQIENARRETLLRINEKILDLKARQAAHR